MSKKSVFGLPVFSPEVVMYIMTTENLGMPALMFLVGAIGGMEDASNIKDIEIVLQKYEFEESIQNSIINRLQRLFEE